MKGLVTIAALVAVLPTAGAARGAEETVEPTPAQVRSAAEAFDRGREAYKAEEYAEAAEQFESADANAPSPAALELAIRARVKANQLDRAATLAALALARHPDDSNIQKIAPSIVERAKRELSQIDIKCGDPCDVTVGGKIAPGRRASERTLFVTPGAYAVLAGWSQDRSASKQVTTSRGQSETLEFEPPALPPSPATEPPKPSVDPGVEAPPVEAPRRKRPVPQAVFWAGIGLTGVSTVFTIWSGIDTKNNPGPDAVRAACQAKDPNCDSLYQKGLDKQHRTNVLIGVSSVLGVATGVLGLFFTDFGGSRNAGAESSRASLDKPRAFGLTPWFRVGNGASVGALGRF